VVASVGDPQGPAVRLAGAAPLDHRAGAAPIGHRVTRRAGRGWLLVGDATGFLDPFTGEGLHRALVSATLAADGIGRELDGVTHALEDYDRAMRGRFAAKDVVSLVVQAFVARPPLLEYAARRLAARRSVGRTLELALADLVPATRALDPRFLAALLAP
jgi:flavin-dependent dehydrogenase